MTPMPHLPIMADAVDPDLIPSRFTIAMPYINGWYSWPKAAEHRFGRVIRISVEPGQPEAARYARALDVEPGAAGIEDIAPFMQRRASLGHHDGTTYANVTTIAQIPPQVAQDIVRLIVAWWWNQPGYPAREDVHAQLGTMRDYITIDQIWGCQFRHHAGFDETVVYGQRDFSR